jgi:hypothetical protein
MGRRERRRRERERKKIEERLRKEALQPSDKKAKTSHLSRQILKAPRPTWKIMSTGATLTGLLGIYILKSSVAIEPYSSTDPTRPFAQQLSEQNTSVYAIHHVEPMCDFR